MQDFFFLPWKPQPSCGTGIPLSEFDFRGGKNGVLRRQTSFIQVAVRVLRAAFRTWPVLRTPAARQRRTDVCDILLQRRVFTSGIHQNPATKDRMSRPREPESRITSHHRAWQPKKVGAGGNPTVPALLTTLRVGWIYIQSLSRSLPSLVKGLGFHPFSHPQHNTKSPPTTFSHLFTYGLPSQHSQLCLPAEPAAWSQLPGVLGAGWRKRHEAGGGFSELLGGAHFGSYQR